MEIKYLWKVTFDVNTGIGGDEIPGIDGEMLVRGDDIGEAFKKAEEKLKTFGFANVIITCIERDIDDYYN